MKIRLGDTEIELSRYLALWGAVALVSALQRILHDASLAQLFPPTAYFRWSIIQWYTWAALAPWVFRLAERYPIRIPIRVGALGIHLLASIGMTSVALLAGALVSTLFEPGFVAQLHQFSLQRTEASLLTYWALVAIQQAVQFHTEKTSREIEASRLASELAQSRLHILRAQLQPHFLFNTLHTIVTLLDEDKQSAEEMLLRLSDLLRVFLEDYGGQEISLRRELALLDLYLGIQRTRFRDRLTSQIHIAPDTLDCAVPSLILQPIVENAIRHGIGQRVGADCIQIESRREGDTLCLDVRNRNSTLEAGPADSAGHGIGMSNTRLRLRELYGDAAQVRLDMIWPEGVACRIRMPFRELDGPDEAPEYVPA